MAYELWQILFNFGFFLFRAQRSVRYLLKLDTCYAYALYFLRDIIAAISDHLGLELEGRHLLNLDLFGYYGHQLSYLFFATVEWSHSLVPALPLESLGDRD